MQEDQQLYEKCLAAVDARLSGRRLEHVHSVSEYAEELAAMYGVDEFDAKMAGLLHDWDKLLTDDEFEARVEELDIERPERMDLLLPVMHSFTGAKAVQLEFPELSDEIISAIWHHTLGGSSMSDLDMVIFIADMIEPTRKTEGRPEVIMMRNMAGRVCLGKLYYLAYQETMRSLINRGRFIHPMAFDIWNSLVEQYNPMTEERKARQGRSDTVL